MALVSQPCDGQSVSSVLTTGNGKTNQSNHSTDTPRKKEQLQQHSILLQVTMPPKTKKTNSLPRTGASSKIGKGRNTKGEGTTQAHHRSAATISRINMYKSGKAIRNKDGKIVGGNFQMNSRAGDSEITAATGRIQPDRRWFGNTRVVDATKLDTLREQLTSATSDPYSVVLKRQHVPLGLLRDVAEANSKKTNNAALLEHEPFQQVFGKQSRRKRVKVEQYMKGRKEKRARTDDKEEEQLPKDQATAVPNTSETNAGAKSPYAALLSAAQTSQSTYESVNAREDIVPWGKDHQVQRDTKDEFRTARKDELFSKGQSKRIWGELFKVLDCSDVVLHVIDARNVPGTRCTMIERHLRSKQAQHKHLVFVLNKIDLVPQWVAKRWMGELAKDRPTIAFHASMTHAFGKGALIALLRQFGKLHPEKKEISVGVVGYPNVGKSSVINTLLSKKSCNVAPIPGETKVWQYVSLFKRISLIDCPGVVVDTAGDTETDLVLKGVVRAERLEHPDEFVPAIMERVQRIHLNAQYKLSKANGEKWQTAEELLEAVALQMGRLKKGGDPCIRSAAIALILDYQRGRLPHYVPPPELKTTDEAEDKKRKEKAANDSKKEPKIQHQDLEKVGIEHMQPEGGADEEEKATDETPAGKEDIKDVNDTTTIEASAESLIGAGEWDD